MYEPNNEQIQAVIISNDMIEQISLLNELVNDETLSVKIDPLKIYCQKTGHIIGQRDENSLFNTIKFCGKDTLLKSLYNSVSISVHPAWIADNGRDLDILIDQDPVGYACYCFSLITAEFYQNSHNIDRKRHPWVERYWAMARANALLSQRGIGELSALNIELCKLLTYGDKAKKYLFKRARELAKTPDRLALLAVTGELTPLLKDCVNRTLAAIGTVDHYVDQTRYVDNAATPADAARGPSNIRQQKASKRDVKEASMFAELRKLFDDSGLEGMGIFRNKSTMQNGNVGILKSRITEIVDTDNEEKMLQDLYNFGGTNLDDMFIEADDENANDVEVNTLAIPPSVEDQEIAQDIIETINDAPINQVMVKIAQAVQENMPDAILPNDMVIDYKLTPQKPLTALELIRARKTQK